jgi:hypothetical protein
MYSADSTAKCAYCTRSGVAHARIGTPSLLPSTHLKLPTRNATRYVDIFGVRANCTVCSPTAGPAVSETTLVFEITISSFGATMVVSKVALYAGSSKDGNARRASVGSNCVTA